MVALFGIHTWAAASGSAMDDITKGWCVNGRGSIGRWLASDRCHLIAACASTMPLAEAILFAADVVSVQVNVELPDSQLANVCEWGYFLGELWSGVIKSSLRFREWTPELAVQLASTVVAGVAK